MEEEKKMEKKSFLLISLILLLSFMSFAELERGGQYGGLGGADIGAQWIDVENLNKVLQSKNLPQLNDVVMVNGGGGYGVMGRFIIGGEGYAISTRNKSNKKTVQLDIGYGLFDLGYLVFSRNALRVYILGGIGGGEMSLITSQEPELSDFNSQLENYNENHFNTEFPVFKIGLNGDYILTFSGDSAAGGLAIGISAGYVFAPVGYVSQWRLAEQTIGDVPDFGPSGPYVTIRIGGGGIAF